MGATRRWFDSINATVTATGTVSALVVEYIVPPEAPVTGQRFCFILGPDLTNTGAVTLDIGVNGPLPIYLDNVDLIGGELLDDHVTEVAFRDGDNPYYELLSTRASVSLSRLPPGADPAIYTSAPRLVLRDDTTFYVSSATGSDVDGWGGNGGNEWATLQYAYDWLVENIDAAGHIVTIYQSGTDSGGIVATVPIVGALYCALTINGNIATPNPWAIAAVHSGVKLEVGGGGTVAAASYGVVASEGGYIGWQGVNFSNCGSGHMYAQNSSTILIRNSYSINTGTIFHWVCDTGASITVYPSAGITVVGTPGFSGSFALASAGGNIICQFASFGGSATGIRYVVTTGGGIFVGGAGADFLPGDAAGSADAATYAYYA